MAYMSQENKKSLAPKIKNILAKYGVKGSIGVDNHSTLVVNIKSGPIDFISNYNETVGARAGGFRLGSAAVDCLSVNKYWYHEQFTGAALDFLNELVPAMMIGNHDNSNSQTDYFDVGWYIDINIGKWNKPYELV